MRPSVLASVGSVAQVPWAWIVSATRSTVQVVVFRAYLVTTQRSGRPSARSTTFSGMPYASKVAVLEVDCHDPSDRSALSLPVPLRSSCAVSGGSPVPRLWVAVGADSHMSDLVIATTVPPSAV